MNRRRQPASSPPDGVGFCGRWLRPGLLVSIAAIGSIPSAAQDYTHPREMRFPQLAFERPDPAAFRFALGNGLVAYAVPDRTVPLVSIVALVAAGSADGEVAGVAEALAAAIRRGPSDREEEAVADRLAAMAAAWEVSVALERTDVSISVPATDAEEALAHVARSLRSPRFDAGGEDEAAPATVVDEDEDPYGGSLDGAVEAFRDHLFADHRFGRRPSAAEVAAVSQAEVRRFHRTFVVPGNVVIAIAGDLSPEAMRRAVREHFGDWARRPVPARLRFPPRATEAPRKLITHAVDKLQGWVVLGHELPPGLGDDRAALEVMNYILGGGHFDTRLFRAARDRRGLTNDNSGFLEPADRGPGVYTFRTYGRPEVVPLLIELTLREIERIRREPVTEEELFVARGALADGAFPMRFVDGHATARSFAEEYLRFGDHRRSGSYRSRIARVSAEDVQRAAQKYLHPERMDILVLGPLEKIRAAEPIEGERRLDELAGTVPGRGKVLATLRCTASPDRGSALVTRAEVAMREIRSLAAPGVLRGTGPACRDGSRPPSGAPGGEPAWAG